jgi:hypothetical protein
LLPAQRPFGGRALWHPDAFYKCLQDALMPAGAADVDGKSVAPSESPAAPAKDAIQIMSSRSPKDPSAVIRQRQREAERLGRLNGTPSP